MSENHVCVIKKSQVEEIHKLLEEQKIIADLLALDVSGLVIKNDTFGERLVEYYPDARVKTLIVDALKEQLKEIAARLDDLGVDCAEGICEKCPYTLGEVEFFASPCPECKNEGYRFGRKMIEERKKVIKVHEEKEQETDGPHNLEDVEVADD